MYNKIFQLVSVGTILLSSSISFAAEGVIPEVSDHYKAMPMYYDLNRMPVEQISPNIGRRFIMGTQSSLVRWDLKAGTKLPLHFHINEQITSVKEGVLAVYSQGNKYTLRPGQMMIFPPNVPHEFVAVEDVVIIEVHTPGRQDFINGEFNNNLNKQ